MKQNILKNSLNSTLLVVGLLSLTACPEKSTDNKIFPTNQVQNQPTNPNTNPAPQADTIYKSVQCEFEAQRTSEGKYFNSNMSIPKTIALISFDGRHDQNIDLRRKFLGIDFGKFGTLNLKYVPAAATKSGSDTLILVNQGLNKNLRLSQSGFAGQEIKLEAQSEGLFMTASCKGTAQFKSPVANVAKTNLACKGKSKTIAAGEQEIELLRPLNSIVAEEEFELSDAVSVKLNKTGTAIAFRANIDSEFVPVVNSSVSLKAPVTFKTSDGLNEELSVTFVNVTCNLQ